MAALDRSAWVTRTLKGDERRDDHASASHLTPAERMEALWQLIVDGVAIIDAARPGRLNRDRPTPEAAEPSTDESTFRRDIVRVIRRGR